MSYFWILFTLFSAVLILYLLYQLYIYLVTDGRYGLYKKMPCPTTFIQILERLFPFYKQLPHHLKKNLCACIQTFIKEKEFIGIKVDIDQTKKILVAANACLLTVGRDRCEYKHVKTIILYPSTMKKEELLYRGYVVSNEESYLLGEAEVGGTVVLSWRDLVAGDLNPTDGKNVGLHEFAHQLDMEDGYADGTPELDWKLYQKWTKIMQKEYEKIKKLYLQGKKSVLDHYATTNAAEFFAAATEAFFEKPKRLKQEESELYDLLKEFYKLDPATW